jgi:hypothetical protein
VTSTPGPTRGFLIAATLLLASPAALAQSGAEAHRDRVPTSESAARPANTRAAWPGDSGRLLLDQGRMVYAKVVSLVPDGEHIVLRMVDGKQLRPRQEQVVLLLGEMRQPLPAPLPVRLELADGRTFLGTPVERSAVTLTVRTDAGLLELQTSEVKSITYPTPDSYLAEPELERTVWPDPALVRLMAMPTAFTLRDGELSLSILEGLQPSLAYGITGWLQVSAGTVVDASYADGVGLNAYVLLTAQYAAGELIRLSPGLRWSWDRSGHTLSLAGAVTFGTEGKHLSAYVGPAPVATTVMGPTGDRVYGLGGRLTPIPRLALVSENWLADPGTVKRVFNGLALRVFGARHSLDLGVVAAWSPGKRFAGSEIRPWLGVTFSDFPADRF